METLFFRLTALEQEAALLSLQVATASVFVSLPMAIAIAWLLVRYRFPGRVLLDGLVSLPLVVPPVVVGYLLLMAFGRRGPIGSLLEEWFGIVFAFRWEGAVLASVVMGFPLMVRSIRLSLEAVDPRLEEAACTLGAGPVTRFTTVILPLITPGLITGSILGFARSLGEFGATITFVSNIPGETRTLPIALYSLLQSPDGDAPALRLAVISVLVAFAALLASEWYTNRATTRMRGRE